MNDDMCEGFPYGCPYSSCNMCSKNNERKLRNKLRETQKELDKIKNPDNYCSLCGEKIIKKEG